MIARAPEAAFEQRLEHYRQRVDARLARALESCPDTPRELGAAMEYSVLGSGKRIRPLLTYATGELLGLEGAALDTIAAAVELIHAYSLIHDDLPAMDDDDLRRGRPTTHRAFDEAIAILAGDGLQALAFESLSTDEELSAHPTAQVRIIRWLARAAGPQGMVGGQVLDIEAEGRTIDEQALEQIHRRKTGQLIRASIMMPSELANLSAARTGRLDAFATDIGLIFQIRDDLLEVEQDTATLGKSAGSDQVRAKSTYPSVLGAGGARRRADELYARALTALATLGENSAGLRWVSEYILHRSR
jgi:farnesyl diphosphate synthase